MTLEYKVPREFLETKPLTIAYIRDSVRRNVYIGDLFEALTFMLTQYDIINSRLQHYTKPTTYNVISSKGDVV
jgi:hypothetical protein